MILSFPCWGTFLVTQNIDKDAVKALGEGGLFDC